jgi:hypothetical protein
VLRDYVLENIDGLRQAFPNLSTNTIQRLMKPPKKNTKAAKRYLSLIDARPAGIENDEHKFTPQVFIFSSLFFKVVSLIGASHLSSCMLKRLQLSLTKVK